MLRLPGPVPHAKAAALPALVLHGAVHGRAGGLRQETGEEGLDEVSAAARARTDLSKNGYRVQL